MAQNITYLTTANELNSVANAIRTKGGTSATLEYPQGFIDAIDDIETGGGGVSSLSLSGDFQRFLYCDAAKNQRVALSNPQINITNAYPGFNYAFACENGGTSYGVDYSNININSVFYPAQIQLAYMFQNNTEITENNMPKLNCTISSPGNTPLNFMFSNTSITTLPNDWLTNLDFTNLNATTNNAGTSMFSDCRKLRTLPASFISKLYTSATSSSNSSKFWNQLFYNCYGLDGIEGFPAPNLTYTNNRFMSTFNNNYHLSTFEFETNSGTPYTRSWTNQVVDLSTVGWFQSAVSGTAAGLPAAKEITDTTTYDDLKNDPDAWTSNVAYSRFDHDSAVALINSLPDTSAVSLPSAPSNTVKFKSGAGASTDAGAISTLTQAEIDVAVNKGWTIQLVS